MLSFFLRKAIKTSLLFPQTIVAKKLKDSLKTRAELVILRTYVEKQAILEPILLYRASKCKQMK